MTVPLFIFNSTCLKGGLVLFQVFHIFRRGSGSTDVDSSSLYFLSRCLFLLYCTAPFTSRRALVHLYFSSLPIDLGVMVFEPDIAKDHALLSKAGDNKECPFRVNLIMEDYVYHFGNLLCFVGEAIYIVYQYGTGDALGINTLCIDKIFIYETACSSRVQKHLDRVHLTGISGTDLNREDDEHSMDIEGIGGESFGESLFPFWPPRQGLPV